MASADFLLVCITTFVAVFIVLTALALFMRLLLVLFPAREEDDAAVLAAVTSTLQALYPGTRVSKIEGDE